MSVPRVTKPPGRARAAQRTGTAMAVIMTGVLMTAVEPVGLAALAVATLVLHDRAERSRRRLDLPGMITLGLGLAGVLWAMTAARGCAPRQAAARCNWRSLRNIRSLRCVKPAQWRMGS